MMIWNETESFAFIFAIIKYLLFFFFKKKVVCVYSLPQSPEEGVRFPAAGVTGDYELCYRGAGH